jgi:acetyl-CoA carboxylase carboxyltransferase component
MERFAWPRTHVHVMARDGAAQVWVRDGTLDENERRRLAVQLAARLRASGVRLATLVVNGEEIHNLEGVTSWQSKQ